MGIVLKCEQLEEELRNRDAEVATLRRLSVCSSAMTPQMAAPSPTRETRDEGARRQLFPSVSNGTSMCNASEPKSTTNAIATSSPAPVVSSSDSGADRRTAAK